MVRSVRTAPVKRRMHPIGLVTTVLQALRQFIFLFVAVFLGGNAEEGAWLQVGLLLLAVLYGVGRWWRLRYWFEDGAMRVSDGFLMHREVFLDADKVQAVDLRAGLLQRVFNVVRVQIKTGANGTQVDLTALSRVEAERIQRLLDPERDRDEPSPELERRAEEPAPAAQDPRWQLTSKELIGLGATAGQLGVIGSFLAWIFGQAHESITAFIETNLQRFMGEAEATAAVMGPLVVAALIVGGLALTWALSIVGTAISWGDFAIQRRRDRVVVARGLLERREVSVLRARIQAITVVEELLHQPLERCAVYVESIGHAEEKGASTCLHPFLPLRDLPAFLDDIVPGAFAAPALLRPPRRALPRFLFVPSALLLAAAAAAFALWGGVGLLLLLLLPPLWAARWLAWRDTGAGVEGTMLVVRSRALSRRTAFVPRKCIQTAEATSNPFQRRRDVSSFEVVAASGNTGRVYVARDLAGDVPDRLLAWAGHHGDAPASATSA